MPHVPLSILNVFNRYRHPGGEEFAVGRIQAQLSHRHQVRACHFDSQEWARPHGPSTFGQVWRLFYNPTGRERFEAALETAPACDLAVFHNIYPVGSPALYHAAKQRKVPVVQFLHNYRPFSVGGTLYSRGRILPDPLRGSYRTEVKEGAWMGSMPRSLLMAVLLKMLHRSGWLKSVHTWIAISDFMRERLVEAGAVPADRIVTLRHAWEALPHAPDPQDAGYYLFLGRLVPEKGLPTLLDAWDQLRAQLGKKTPALHVAGEGPLHKMVIDRARTNPFICSLGQMGGESKAEQLRRCRAVIIPSVWWEPLGLVTYEAFDNAKPVLAARSGGLTETVEQDATGLLHEPGQADSLVRDLVAMEAMTPARRLHMGAAGRSWLRRETDPALWVRRFEEIAARAVRPGVQG